MRRTRIKALSCATLLAVVIPFAATADANEGKDRSSGDSTTGISNGLLAVEPLDDLGDNKVPDDVRTLTETIHGGWGDETVSFVDYDRDTNTVDVLVSPYAERDDVDDIQALDERVRIRHAKYSRREFADIAHELSGTKIGDATIWGAGPNLEHDGLIIYAEPDDDARLRGTQAFVGYRTTIRGFEATVRLGGRPVPAAGAPR